MQEPVAPEHRSSLRFTAKYAIFFHAAFTLHPNTEANETNENSSVTTKEEKKPFFETSGTPHSFPGVPHYDLYQPKMYSNDVSPTLLFA